MSKPMKELIMADYQSRFGELEGALVVDVRGIEANTNNEMRVSLAEKDIRITVIKNTLARKSFAGTALEPLAAALTGPSAIAYGGSSVVDVAREVVQWAKKIELLDLKGAVIDGEYFDGEAGVKRLSQFPTREEAQARIVSLALAPAGNVIGAATSGGSNLMGIIKEIQERLEEGKTISKVG